jgi:hypothetical protein
MISRRQGYRRFPLASRDTRGPQKPMPEHILQPQRMTQCNPCKPIKEGVHGLKLLNDYAAFKFNDSSIVAKELHGVFLAFVIYVETIVCGRIQSTFML